jgi:acetyl esterase/lipase
MTITLISLLAMAVAAQVNCRPMNPVGAMLCWLFSWLGQSFAPQLALIALVLLAWSLAGKDGTPVTNGFAALAALVAAILFLRVYRLGQQTDDSINRVVDTALDRLETPGANDNTPPRRPEEGTVPVGWLPFSFGGSRVQRVKNVAYGPAGRENCLDIYQPLQLPDDPMPILIHVPGGAWVSGSKNQQGLPLLNHMAAQGWTCFNINYRLGPKSRFPAMLEDVLRAIAWVKSNARDYGANPDFIAITGGSAGGHLLSLAALLRDRERFQPGFEQIDTRISVAVPIYGRYDFLNSFQLLPGEGLEPFLTAKVMPGSRQSCPELWELASPQRLVHADAPPFLVIHGSADSMIPVEEARGFVRELRAASNEAVDYAELPGAQHGFDMLCTSWAMPTVYAVRRYLDAHYAAHLHATKSENEGA